MPMVIEKFMIATYQKFVPKVEQRINSLMVTVNQSIHNCEHDRVYTKQCGYLVIESNADCLKKMTTGTAKDRSL